MTELEKLEAGLEYCYDDLRLRRGKKMLCFNAKIQCCGGDDWK